jgi:hypothetical protein
MKYVIKNKTSTTHVLLIKNATYYLLAKGNKQKRDIVEVSTLTPQLKNMKNMKFIQINKVD